MGHFIALEICGSWTEVLLPGGETEVLAGLGAKMVGGHFAPVSGFEMFSYLVQRPSDRARRVAHGRFACSLCWDVLCLC